MRFEYTISEDNFLKGVRLSCRTQGRKAKIILSLVILFLLLITVGPMISRGLQPEANDQPQLSSSSVGRWVPILVITVCFAMALQAGYYGPRRLRQLYRKNPAMHGVIRVEITPESIVMESTAEFSSRSKWNLYEFWSEQDSLIVLVLLSRVFVILNIADLAEPQREELRAILASVLTKK
jgi:hypothetical protein